MSVIEINCVMCGKVAGAHPLDAEDGDFLAFCKDCLQKFPASSKIQEYAVCCPGCDKLLLAAMKPNHVTMGECVDCKTPLKYWTMSGTDGRLYAHVEKLYGGPNAAKMEGEPEWEV